VRPLQRACQRGNAMFSIISAGFALDWIWC
jgi:hypothetical protein